MIVNGYTIKSFANLQSADLQGAKLQYADLRGANLLNANLQDAKLQYANLRGANLRGANLQDANLRGANLWDANLRGADLRGADLPDFQFIPAKGDFLAYKKVKAGVIQVLCRGKRTCSLVGRKVRAEMVKPLDLKIPTTNIGYGSSTLLKYRPNRWTKCDSFNDDIRIECTHGIHVYLTKEEAENQ
jgi:hypothetical protein